MEIGVKVRWPGNERSGLLSNERAECHYGQPVLVMEGQALGIVELPPGAKIYISWRKARVGPVWSLIQESINAGYPVEIEAA